MTQALFMVTNTKNYGEGGGLVNGVRTVLINEVSTANAATCIASAASAANLAYQGDEGALNDSTMDAFGPDYFDTVVTIGDLSGGPLNGNLKALTFDPNAGPLASTAAV